MKTVQNLKNTNDFIKIFWGILLITLDITFNGIDFITPDFIGYILITSALYHLSKIHQSFTQAKILSTILIFLSLTDFINPTNTISLSPPYENINLQITPIILVAFVKSILQIIMIYSICSDLVRILDRNGSQQLKFVAIQRKNLYVAIEIIKYICLGLIYFNPLSLSLISKIIFPVFLLSLISAFLIMGLMKKAAKEITT